MTSQHDTRLSKILLPFLAVMVSMNGPAAAFDLQSCPMDALTFVDPWSRAEFPVSRVGTDFYFVCGDNEVISRDPSDAATCRGPYGDIMLEGSLISADRELRLVAVYSSYWSTAPCCGWAVYGVGRPDIDRRVTWLPKGTSPALGDWPFASIHNSWGDRADLDGFAALKCAVAPG